MPGVYCTFRVGGLLVGVDGERVQEILHDPELTPVPLAHDSVVGLLNLRGQIVTAIDARRRLGLDNRNPEERTAHVIVRCRSEAVSLVVDVEDEVVEVEAPHDVPETFSSDIRQLVTGVHELDSRLLLVLDADRTLSVTADDDRG